MSQESSVPVKEAPTLLQRGYVQIYTGDGKGKTTAAIGLAVRAAGAGLRVFIAQFIKEGRYSEIQALECFGEKITCRQYGRGRWIRGRASEDDALLARRGLDDVRSILTSGEYQVVILDEALLAAWMRMLDVDELLDLIDLKPGPVELVLTGRRADPRLVERADLVTEMREVKHYYRQGVRAREGIES
ncbi:MAG: cob(I)yrinic acid a,c-diamide adenosyltransferase [Thermoleophilia bacterium]|nr:cob(I)yrinic acid a,c-diamide adenosyltransferase [Thermoleophilia bacterium]